MASPPPAWPPAATAALAITSALLELRIVVTRLPVVSLKFRPTTLVGYRSIIKNHLVPHLGSLKLRNITPERLARFYAELGADGRMSRKGMKRDGFGERTRGGELSQRTVLSVHKVLHGALDDAVTWNLLARNPADKCAPKVSETPEMKCWDSAQLRTFITADDDSGRLAALCRLVGVTGMRRGELCGLRWSDVDLDDASLSIVRTRTSAGYTPVEGDPKSDKSKRVITLDPSTVAALKAHKTRQATERLAAGPSWVDSGLVFAREDGTPFHPQTITYLFDRRVERLKLPKIRLHDVRHSYATAGLENGMNPRVMQERLGHSNVAITLGIYSHVKPEFARQAADGLAAHILGG